MTLPMQSPFFHAKHSERYNRQTLIREYEQRFGVRLIVMIDHIFPECVTIFEDLVYDADPKADLHLMLVSPGGDGETAIRLVRAAQARCRELTIIVPEQAKSAATLLSLGAHHILMGPTSDLGPVDPQVVYTTPQRGEQFVAAKDLIAAHERALKTLADNPDAWPLIAAMFAETDGTLLEFAHSAIARTEQVMTEAIASHPDRTADEIETLVEQLKPALISEKATHAAVFGAQAAAAAGLPIIAADPECDQWRLIWALWTKYYLLRGEGYQVYEGVRVSHLFRTMPAATPA